MGISRHGSSLANRQEGPPRREQPLARGLAGYGYASPAKEAPGIRGGQPATASAGMALAGQMIDPAAGGDFVVSGHRFGVPNPKLTI